MNLLNLFQIEILSKNSSEVVLSMPVLDEHKQPYGMVHGGVYGVLIETAASIGGMENVNSDEFVVGIDLQVNHLKSVSSGTLITKAKPNHIGNSLHVWEATIYSDKEDIIAVGRCSLLPRKKH